MKGGEIGLPTCVHCHVARSTLGVLLPHLQALLGLFKAPCGLLQTSEDGQRIPLGQVMTQVKQIRDAQAAQSRVGYRSSENELEMQNWCP